MVELSLRSAGVSTREIDLTGPTAVVPIGVPAGVIGTAEQGPAFVPITVANENQFRLQFGEDGNAGLFGPIAVTEWLRNAQAATFLRVLGVGLGEKRTTSGDNAGRVESAGFVVGAQLPDADGSPGDNELANAGGIPGRVHFLGCYMSESAGSTFFSEAGRQVDGEAPVPTIRAIVFAPSGVVPTLATSSADTPPTVNTVATSAGPQGSVTGTVILLQNSIAKQEFVMFLNGHKGTDSNFPNVITASFDVTAPNYISNVFNSDPALIQNAGHLLYTHYDVHSAFAAVTGSGLFISANEENIAFLTTGALARNSGSATVPSYENFEDRFQTPKTPFFISQQFGGNNQNLFRVHALSDGAFSNRRLKISIENVAKSTVDSNRFGTFDLLVRQLSDDDENKVVLERFSGLTLDPSHDRYIARAVGDFNLLFDFDKNVSSQKLRQDGQFANRSNFVRVEVVAAVEDLEVDATALPVGFRGPPHLVVSGTDPLATVVDDDQHHLDADITGTFTYLNNATEPPIPLRRTVAVGSGQKKDSNTSFYWGVHFELSDNLAEPNLGRRSNATIGSLTEYFSLFHTSWQSTLAEDNAGAADTAANGIIDSDRYNNNIFTLERIQVVTGSDGVATTKNLEDWEYVRDGIIAVDDSAATRAFDPDVDLASLAVRNVAKFSVYLQGGFDGVNIFDADAAALNNRAVTEEMDFAARGQNDGPTVKAYLKALELMGNTAEVDVKVMAIPGIRHEVVTDEVVNTTELRFDAIALMDVEERDTLNNVVSASADQQIGVGNTVNAFSLRGLDTSFAAAYFPDVVLIDPFSGLETRVPPTVAALGALSLNDAIARPWNAPAGVTRGALDTTVDVAVRLSRANMDDLYDVDINPIVSFPGTDGVVIWGQKTLLRNQSALDRINVRRLLIEVRREVKAVANTILFEPNREATLARFNSLVIPVLQRIQDQQGVDGFRVVIDTSTTTQADVENNTIRGKIFLQPTRTAEFVDLDFVLSNQSGFAGA